jgi:hypothetical protein
MIDKLPKLLIVSRLNWDDHSNSNTLSNFFENYDPDRIARIYIETKQPNTQCCKLFYQISEIALIKKLLHPKLKTGKTIITSGITDKPSDHDEPDKSTRQEASIMSYVRGHRSWLFTVMRDLLWLTSSWKSKDLRKFIHDFKPDVVWLDGSPLILMNRLNNFIREQAQAPSVTFLMDDVYSYSSCPSTISKIYKFFLRRYVREAVRHANHIFVSSPLMKQEYDELFNINSTFITKSYDFSSLVSRNTFKSEPLKLLYLGNILIGRIDTLCELSQTIKEINSDRIRISLDIYTGDPIDEKHKELLKVDGVTVNGLVPYNQVAALIESCDVQVFVESLSRGRNKIARLSFSTKILDYIKSGKCILAIGPEDIAPIKYFIDEDAAVVARNRHELKSSLIQLLKPEMVEQYAHKTVSCAKRLHDKKHMQNNIYKILSETASQPSK